MLKRKITNRIEEFLKSGAKKMLIIDGARQIGKSFIIRHVGKKMFSNYIEINMERDKQNDRAFAQAKTLDSFYLALSSIAGQKMKDRNNTLVFIDEIQAYPHLLTLAKFLVEDNKFTYIASGSLLGVTLQSTQSIPVGYIEREQMYPLDFEEFLWANNVGELVIEKMRDLFKKAIVDRQYESLDSALNQKILDLFRRYLLVGGLPEAVNTYIESHNIVKVRTVQNSVLQMYALDAAKYEQESSRKLKIQRIYQMIPSNLENHKKRVVVKDIEGKVGKRTSDYQDEFDYLVSSGIALEVDAVSQPVYPLIQNAGKNLLKLYINDVGLFTNILYKENIRSVIDDICSVNLGAVYETAVAQELKAHGFGLFYYDNKKVGEVDYLIDDADTLSPLPIEVKSGRDYTIHSALSKFMKVPTYNIKRACVLSNEASIYESDGIVYMPIYNVMFFKPNMRDVILEF